MAKRNNEWILTADAAELLTGDRLNYSAVTYLWKTGKLRQRWVKSPRRVYYLRSEVERLKRARVTRLRMQKGRPCIW